MDPTIDSVVLTEIGAVAIPEPSSLILATFAMIGLLVVAGRSSRKKA